MLTRLCLQPSIRTISVLGLGKALPKNPTEPREEVPELWHSETNYRFITSNADGFIVLNLGNRV